MCIDMCMHVHVDMCIDMCIYINIEMCIHMCIDMAVEMCIHMSIHTQQRGACQQHAYGCAHGDASERKGMCKGMCQNV